MMISRFGVVLAVFVLVSCQQPEPNDLAQVSEAPVEQKMADSNHLPEPGPAFFERNKEAHDLDYKYFEAFFGPAQARVYRPDSVYGDSCCWVQKFKGGQQILVQSYESGGKVVFTFPGYDKSELRKFVKWFYESDENSWNKDSTQYYPTEGDAGCYYDIGTDSLQQNFIEVYCGC